MRIGLRTSFSKAVHGAADARRSAVEHVRIDHRGLDVAMAQELLDGPDVISAFEEVSGERVADVMKVDEPLDPMAIGLLGTAAVMAGAQRFAKLV